MPPSMASCRSWNTFSKRGNTVLISTQHKIANAIVPMMTSPQAGMSGLVSSPEAKTPLARTVLTPVIFGPNSSGAEDERHDEADQGERLSEREAQEQVGTGKAGGLWLTRSRV